MVKKNSAQLKNQATIVPTSVSGSRHKCTKSLDVDYNAIASAIENSDLHSREESGNVTGLHRRDCTILVQRLTGNKYRGRDTFGWLVWIKPKRCVI